MIGNKIWLNNGNGTFTNSGQSLGMAVSMRVALDDLDVITITIGKN